jgi:hypothetical protein
MSSPRRRLPSTRSTTPRKNQEVMSDFHTWDWTGDRLRVRIIKIPDATQFELFDVSRFEVGQVYEIGTRLAELMMVDGCAEPDVRAADRAADKSLRKPRR